MRIQLEGYTLNVEEQGQGPHTLIFLHYFGGSAQTWREVSAALAHQAHCIALDLKGFGASDAPLTGYTMAEQANDLAAVIEALKLKRYTLVGHSMGGKIALAFAARPCDDLQELILVAPSPPTPEPMSAAERERLLSGYGQRQAAEATLHKITVQPLSTAQRESIIADNLRSSQAAWRAWLETGSREDISAQMANVQVPVTVIAGSTDPVIDLDLIKHEVLSRFAHESLITLAQIGHLSPLEAPEQLAGAIGAVLNHQVSSSG